jgi:hypothetical protein
MSYGSEFSSIQLIPSNLLFFDPTSRDEYGSLLNSQTRAFESTIQGLKGRVEELETERDNQKGVLEAFVRQTAQAGIIPTGEDSSLATVMKGITELRRQYFFTRIIY